MADSEAGDITPTDQKTRKLTFLTLPAEIRKMFYEVLCPPRLQLQRKGFQVTAAEPNTRILRTCRQIYAEAAEVFYQNVSAKPEVIAHHSFLDHSCTSLIRKVTVNNADDCCCFYHLQEHLSHLPSLHSCTFEFLVHIRVLWWFHTRNPTRRPRVAVLTDRLAVLQPWFDETWIPQLRSATLFVSLIDLDDPTQYEEVISLPLLRFHTLTTTRSIASI
jgi:hypothetical protein